MTGAAHAPSPASPLGDDEARDLLAPLLAGLDPSPDLPLPSPPSAGPAGTVAPDTGAKAGTGRPHLLLAVSGGPDSTALLGLAAAVLPREALAVASVDHGLRREAAREVEAVAAFAAQLGLPFHRLAWEGPKPATGRAEAAPPPRRALLAELAGRIGAGAVVMAHHADDQAETLLLRLAAGSGPSGLAGMRARTPLAPGLLLLRPFLHVPKARLVATCRARGWPFAIDPSNADLATVRARLRRAVATLAGEGLDAVRLGRLATRLGRLDDAVEAAVDEAEGRLVSRTAGPRNALCAAEPHVPGPRLVGPHSAGPHLAGLRAAELHAAGTDAVELHADVAACPGEVRLRLLARLVTSCAAPASTGLASATPAGPRLARLEALDGRLDAARRAGDTLTATLAGVLVRLEADGTLRFSRAPPRRADRAGPDPAGMNLEARGPKSRPPRPSSPMSREAGAHPAGPPRS